MAIESVKYATENGASVDMVIDGEKYTVATGDGLLLYGLEGWIADGGVIEPFYTITGAEMNNPDSDDVISVTTVEAGRVNITEEGNSFLWAIYAKWVAEGGETLPFQDRNKAGREAAEATAAHQVKRDELLDEMIAKGIKVDDLKKLP